MLGTPEWLDMRFCDRSPKNLLDRLYIPTTLWRPRRSPPAWKEETLWMLGRWFYLYCDCTDSPNTREVAHTESGVVHTTHCCVESENAPDADGENQRISIIEWHRHDIFVVFDAADFCDSWASLVFISGCVSLTSPLNYSSILSFIGWTTRPTFWTQRHIFSWS